MYDARVNPSAPSAIAPQPPQHSPASLARRLRLQQLLIFEKVVQAGSILAASRELALTQPALSKSIHELEAQLGGQLFVRGKRGVTLTELGRLFEHHAKTLLGELRYLAEDLNAAQSGAAGQVVVGTLITASATLLPEAITRLRAAAPDVVVTIRVGSSALLFPALLRSELDVVVGVLPDARDTQLADEHATRLIHVPLHQEALRVVVGSQHPLARRRRIDAAQLRDLDWIVPTQDSVAGRSVGAFFSRVGLALPRRRVESVSILTNLELLINSHMVGLMPQSAADRFARAGLLALLPLSGQGAFGAVGYTVRADRPPSAAAQRFLQALRDASQGFASPG